jgi:glucose uptake protein GlcU
MDKSMGFLFISLSVVLFGTNFIPVKQYKTGDGMFFNLSMCTGIWLTGLFVNLVRHANGGAPAFEPLAMVGGFLWGTGNVMIVGIIKCLGLAMGMLICGSFNMLKGWATGSFGFFWPRDAGINHAMNYGGVICCCIALCSFCQVQPETKAVGSSNGDDEYDDEYSAKAALIDSKEDSEQEDTWLDRLEGSKKFNIGIVMSVVAGILFGSCFDPATYVMKHNCSPGDPDCYDATGHCLKSRPHCDLYGKREVCPLGPHHALHPAVKCTQYGRDASSSAGLDYVFSQFCGIYLAAVLWTMVYCVGMRNKPKLYPQVVLPAFVSGVMWAIAQFSWFVSNECLQYSVSYPLTTGGPGYIASAIGIYFGEISGKRNFRFFAASLCIQVVGFTLISLSSQ